MQIDKTAWHSRLYLLTRREWARFFDHLDSWDRESKRIRENNSGIVPTDLCTYLRTILLWFPLLVGLHLAVFGYVIWAAIYRPFYLLGAGTVGTTFVGIAVFITACSLLWAVERYLNGFSLSLKAVGSGIVLLWKGFRLVGKKTGVVSLGELIIMGFSDGHEKICSRIEIHIEET